MEFANDVHKATYEQVRGWVGELYGAMAEPLDNDKPGFRVRSGSALVCCVVEPWGDDDACVTFFSWVITKVEQSAALHEYLLRENMRNRYGAFAIDEVGDIIFRWTTPRTSLSKEEIRTGLAAVADSADGYDDDIKKRFGGERASD
jgi:hypothetical protein